MQNETDRNQHSTADQVNWRTSISKHPEEAAVRVPLERYMQGHASDDAAHMREAFLPTAHIESMRDGTFTSWTLDEYCQCFKGSPAADEATRRRSIDFIDIGGTAACGKITLVHGANTFIDYFVLLKTADGWKIANKAFHGQAA
ncbi:MAG: nuclear transport factor 2 family protein [Propionivibrio sp.]